MDWILCRLMPNDYVFYKTSMSEHAENLPYQEFLTLVYPYTHSTNHHFLEMLNRYLTILINTKKESWEIYRKEFELPSFDELFELNQEREEKKKQKDSISSYKNAMNLIFDNKHDRQTTNREGRGVNIRSFFNRYRKK